MVNGEELSLYSSGPSNAQSAQVEYIFKQDTCLLFLFLYGFPVMQFFLSKVAEKSPSKRRIKNMAVLVDKMRKRLQLP